MSFVERFLKWALPFFQEEVPIGGGVAPGKSDGVLIPKLSLLILFFATSCNTDSAPDCLQNSGEIIRREVPVPDFSKITVFEKVGLTVKQGDTQKVEIEAGEFLFEEVIAIVEGDRLILRNENGCNLFREYGLTKVYVTAPNITEIRSSTGEAIISDGVLAYPNLELFSESFWIPSPKLRMVNLIWNSMPRVYRSLPTELPILN
ncbi:GIN domain-containing protein [Maribacter halichondriae]|uniref:GIN domain-containing protein n=1 Tax=Maribacter halichondriae TaxID=2980554 RepID=UPI0023598D5D|nr:DUF2807 domain-containing protein [Maribacter sp. Hal144]